MKCNIAFYFNLISDLINNKIHPSSFQSIFSYIFLMDEGLNKREYEILNKMFWAVEDYVPYPEIREEGDLDEEDLLRVAKEVLEELKKIAGE